MVLVLLLLLLLLVAVAGYCSLHLYVVIAAAVVVASGVVCFWCVIVDGVVGIGIVVWRCCRWRWCCYCVLLCGGAARLLVWWFSWLVGWLSRCLTICVCVCFFISV